MLIFRAGLPVLTMQALTQMAERGTNHSLLYKGLSLCHLEIAALGLFLDCKTVGFFFSESVKKSVLRVSRARLTARVNLNLRQTKDCFAV